MARFLGHPDDVTAASVTAKQALCQMTDREIPSTPQNYTVWYVSGRQPDLIRAIDKMVAEGVSFDHLKHAELFEVFFSSPWKALTSKKWASKSTLF